MKESVFFVCYWKISTHCRHDHACRNAAKNKVYIEPSAGTLNTDTVTFGVYLLIIILVLNALYGLPAFVLGPVSDHSTLSR